MIDQTTYILDGHVHITSRESGSGRSAADLSVDQAGTPVIGAAIVTPSTAGWDNTLTWEATQAMSPHSAAIARVDLIAPDAIAAVQSAITAGARGIRVTMNNEAPLNWLVDGSIDAVCRILDAHRTVVEFHSGPGNFELVDGFARRYPSIPVLTDHMGRPDPAQGVMAPAFQQFLRLAEHPSIATKTANSSFFSGQAAPYEDLAPFLRAALDSFGAHRVMWASDWPLCRERGSYLEALQPTLTVLAERSAEESAQVLHGTFESLLLTEPAH